MAISQLKAQADACASEKNNKLLEKVLKLNILQKSQIFYKTFFLLSSKFWPK